MWSGFPNWSMHWPKIKSSILSPGAFLPIELNDWTQSSRKLLPLSSIHCRLLQSWFRRILPCIYSKHLSIPCLLLLKDYKTSCLWNTPSANLAGGSHLSSNSILSLHHIHRKGTLSSSDTTRPY